MTRRTRALNWFATLVLGALLVQLVLPRDVQAQRTRIDPTFAFAKGG